jgi:hypothetical protein
MSDIVLNLRNLSDLELQAKLRTLATAQTDNPTTAPGVNTTAAALTAAADLIQTRLNAQSVAQAAAEAATDAKDEAVDAGEDLIKDYAAEVWPATGKNPAKCVLLGFDVRGAGSPPPPPGPNEGQITGLTLDFGPSPGQLVMRVDPQARRRSIEIQVNLTPNAAPTWQHHAVSTSSPYTLTGLPSGSLVQVRARANFSRGQNGPWSDIAELRVP